MGLSKPESEITLCEEQKQAVDQIENARKPVTIVTGQAGSGKSTIINHLRRMRTRYTVCATTGKAALNVGGATVDSVFCINRDNWTIWSMDRVTTIMRDIPDRIIIDEASMIGHAMGDLIWSIAETHMKKIILVGDWAQARPVKDDWILGSKLLGDYQYIKLMENHRQDGDQQYMNVLNKLRIGVVDAEVTEVMRSRVVGNPDDTADLRLYATNKKVEVHNRFKLYEHCMNTGNGYVKIDVTFQDLRRASTQSRSPRSQKFIDQQIDNSRMGHDEPLSVGCRALITLNNKDVGVVNGDTGTITRIDDIFGNDLTQQLLESKGDGCTLQVGRIHIALDRGFTAILPRVTAEVKDPMGEIQHTLRGFPVCLGYACTIHKGQGMTVNRAWVDLDSLMHFPNQESRHGLAYVALSRTRTLQGLTLGQWIPNAVHCDPTIKSLI